MNAPIIVGVLALQGAFDAHVTRLRTLDIEVRLIKTPLDVVGTHGLILPGGESTTMSNLMLSSGLQSTLTEKIREGFPMFGTCAGMIMMSRQILDGRSDQISLGAMDIQVRRNGYGRQIDSFEQDVQIDGFETPFHALFIRAPIIAEVGSEVEILARVEDRPVMVRQGSALAASFHPELVSDLRVHEIFLSIINEFNSTHTR